MAQSLVLVTGATGFIAAHIITLLLNEGYSVRGTARSAKIDSLKDAPIGKHPNFSLIAVDDVATDDLTQAMQGVASIIHTATPLAGQVSPEVAVRSAKEGNLNVLECALKAGIHKVVITSSWGTLLDPDLKQAFQGRVLTDKDWGHVTEEETLSGKHDPLWIYLASKLLAEKAAWQFVDENPSIDLATINPPFVYGPLESTFPAPPNPTRLGANIFPYSLIQGGKLPPQMAPHAIDVRDVAKAHVRALEVPPAGRKRFVIVAGWFTWKQAAEYLERAMPQLKERLPPIEEALGLPGEPSTTDVSYAKEALGIKEYIGWEKMIVDTITSILEVEKTWKLFNVL
ncbi:NAD-P-binding protein [Hymenopellis radicata]|nr:NAD-P-binding protein [Hymenopellis radicata]